MQRSTRSGSSRKVSRGANGVLMVPFFKSSKPFNGGVVRVEMKGNARTTHFAGEVFHRSCVDIVEKCINSCIPAKGVFSRSTKYLTASERSWTVFQG